MRTKMTTITASSPHSASVQGITPSLPARIALGLAATVVVAAAAHIAIPLPFTPVPLTLQPLAVLGVGLVLGPVAGFLTMIAYLAEGLCGLPVFSPTGPGGLAQFLGPTGGFLMAYPLVAAIVGGLTPRMAGLRFAGKTHARVSSFVAALIAGHLAMALLFVSGAGWFMHFTHHSLQATWIGAVAPFLPGEVVKVFVAAGVYSTLTRSSRI
jgi:biotin transport system substrate-specific component